MKKIEEFFFFLLKSAMQNGNIVNPLNLTDKEWIELFDLSKKQGVATIIFEEIILHDHNMPFKTKMEWAFHSDSIKKTHQYQLDVTEHLSNLLAEKGIKMMVLKGSGLALCYPHPEYRECGDIDIYCFGDYAEVNQLIKEKGIEIDHEDAKHSHFYFERIPIENHKRMNYDINHANRIVGRELIKHFNENPQIDKQLPNIYLPNLNINALYVIQHALMHLPWSGIPIRILIDWMQYLKKNHDKLDWEYLDSVWKESNEKEIVSILTQICIDYLGMPATCFHASIEYQSKNYKIIVSQILHPWKHSSATKNKFLKLFRRINQYNRRRKAHYITYKEPFPDSLWKSVFKRS